MFGCLFAMWVLGWENCEMPHVRPPQTEVFASVPGQPALYGPEPDCLNRDRHIRYLSDLKALPVQDFDDPVEYDLAIDAYVARLMRYCQ